MQPPSQTVFTARGLTKTYHMGEVEVPALRSLDIEIYQGEFEARPAADAAGVRSGNAAAAGGLAVVSDRRPRGAR